MRDGCHTITIRKRPWWMWLLAVLWLLLEIVFVQTAIASAREFEFRASTISWVIAIVLLIVGLLIWLRQGRSPKSQYGQGDASQ